MKGRLKSIAHKGYLLVEVKAKLPSLFGMTGRWPLVAIKLGRVTSPSLAVTPVLCSMAGQEYFQWLTSNTSTVGTVLYLLCVVTTYVLYCVLWIFVYCLLLLFIVIVVVESHDDSVKAAEAALMLQPDHPSALSALALVYRKIGRLEEAEQLYQRWCLWFWRPLPISCLCFAVDITIIVVVSDNVTIIATVFVTVTANSSIVTLSSSLITLPATTITAVITISWDQTRPLIISSGMP